MKAAMSPAPAGSQHSQLVKQGSSSISRCGSRVTGCVTACARPRRAEAATRTTLQASRRDHIVGTAASLGISGLLLVNRAEAQRRTLQQDPRLQPLREYWRVLVTELQQQISVDFSPSLVFYGSAELLPSGAPGDPAAEYNKNRRQACGKFNSGFSEPYQICPPEPAGVPDNNLARDCCRHFAYCVPRSRYAFAALDRQSSVVASPRLALAHEDTWKGVLVHEMGHCIDFRVFPERYLLPSESPPQSATAAAALAAIDSVESNVELRADLMANALLGPVMGGKKLCYNVATRVQMLVPDNITCAEEDEALDSSDVGYSSSSRSSGFMKHFSHPPVSTILV